MSEQSAVPSEGHLGGNRNPRGPATAEDGCGKESHKSKLCYQMRGVGLLGDNLYVVMSCRQDKPKMITLSPGSAGNDDCRGGEPEEPVD